MFFKSPRLPSSSVETAADSDDLANRKVDDYNIDGSNLEALINDAAEKESVEEFNSKIICKPRAKQLNSYVVSRTFS